MIKKIVCKFKGHILHYAGACPFTGSRYEYCQRCGIMIPIDTVE